MKKMPVALLLVLAILLNACGVLAAEAEPAFPTFGDAVAAAGEEPVIGGNSEYMAVIVPVDGQYYRVVANLDDQAKELDAAISEAEDISAAFDTYYAYVYTLPVSYAEAFIAQPKEQAELDALTGKTIAELEAEGYVTSSSGTAGEEDLIAFWMSDGLYEYELIVDADFDTYEEKQEQDELETLVVRSGRYFGISTRATDLHVHMDGTVEQQEDAWEEASSWLMEIVEAFQAIQNGEEVDLDALFATLTEANPEAAESIAEFMEMYRQMYQGIPEQEPAAE